MMTYMGGIMFRSCILLCCILNPMNTPTPRWYKDAKWLTGFLSLVLCSVTLLFYTLYWFTTEERAVKIMSIAMATAFSKRGLDDVSEFSEIRKQMRQMNLTRSQPIPGLNVYITEEDFLAAKASPRDARIAFFRRLVEPLYRDGPAGLASLAENEDMRRHVLEGAQPLRFFSRNTHHMLQRIFFLLIVITTVCLSLLTFFSCRFGRLVSLAIVLVFSTLPGFLITFFLSIVDTGKSLSVPTGEKTFASVANTVIVLIKPSLKELNVTFGILMLCGFVLLLIAGVGKTIMKIVQKVPKTHKT